MYGVESSFTIKLTVMKTNVKLISAFALVLIIGPATELFGQIKVFDNGNVGIKYTTSTPVSKLVYNNTGETAFDVYFYSSEIFNKLYL